ncbi:MULTISPECIES: hypothetical protein [Burkholderia]|uniref:hypothetical protein n=1 Tax=Burkholderia TaxID=32008 RepID=UPI000A81FFB0|nr:MULTISPECIES: hypothetical protein [unclassified Burkholderia]
MPTTPPIRPPSIPANTNPDDTPQGSPPASPNAYPTARTTSLASSTHSLFSQQQADRQSSNRTVSPISEINFDITFPFSNINPNEQDNFIKEIMAESHFEQKKQSLAPFTPMSVEAIRNWLASESPYFEHATTSSPKNRVELNLASKETVNIQQIPIVSDSIGQKTSVGVQFSGRDTAPPRSSTKITTEILRLGHEKIGIGPGKITRYLFERKYGLTLGSLRFHINIDGTLTARGQRALTRPPRTRAITAELLQKAVSIAKNGEKNISDIAIEIGIQPTQLYPYLTKSGLSLAGKQLLAKHKGETVLRRLTTDLLRLASQRIGNTFDKISLSEFCDENFVSPSLLRKYVKTDGTLTDAGKNRINTKRNKNRKTIKSQRNAIKNAAYKMAKPGHWDFPFASLIFFHSLKSLTDMLNIRLDVIDLENTHHTGNPNAPYAGKLYLKRKNCDFQIGDQCYTPPPGGDRVFHALNALSIYSKKNNFGAYIVGAPQQDGTRALSFLSTDASIKSVINNLRYLATSYIIRNVDEILHSVSEQPPSETDGSPLPTTPAPPKISADVSQPAYSPISSPATPHTYTSPVSMEESLASNARQTPDTITTIGKNRSRKGKSIITPRLLKLALHSIVGKPKNIPSFLKEHGIKLRTLQQYVSSSGLTLAGQQFLFTRKDKKSLNPLTVKLVQLASQSIGIKSGDMNRNDFARNHGVSIKLLKYYLKADGTLTKQGERHFHHWLPLFQKNSPVLGSILDRRRAVREAALKIMKLGEWNFPHADQIFSNYFNSFAFDHNIRFDIKTPNYCQRIGDPSAPYAGALLLNQDHYGIQIGENYYDVPADGDCAFHALNILRLHSTGQGFGDYVVGPQRPDKVIPLYTPTDDSAIKLAVGGARYMAAEHAMRNIDEIVETITER